MNKTLFYPVLLVLLLVSLVSATDIFEASTSGLEIVSTDLTQGGKDAVNMFQSDICIFDDQSGTPTAFSTTFMVDDIVHLDSITLVSTASRLWENGPLIRAAGSIKLEANQRDTGTWVEILNSTITHSEYGDDYTIDNFTLNKSYSITEPHAAYEFRVTFTKLDNEYWAPRIDELDGIGSEVSAPENPDTKYIVVNLSTYPLPSVIDEIKSKLPVVPNSVVVVGIGDSFFPTVDTSTAVKGKLDHLLTLSESRNIPIIANFYPMFLSPSLYNWWDSAKPGYDPNNKDNVEWYGWDNSYAVKGTWVCWGGQSRFNPSPNILSPQYLSTCYDKIEEFMPILKDWWDVLPVDQKKLFIGLKVMSEASVEYGLYYENGNYYLETWPNDPSHDPTSCIGIPTGYAAVSTAGIKSSGSLTEADKAAAVEIFAEALCSAVVDTNIPRDKVMAHGSLLDGTENIYAIMNEYSCPGWSYYGSNLGGPRAEYANCEDAIKKSDAPFWCVPEFFWQGYSTVSNWRGVLTNILDDRCRYVNIFNWSEICDDSNALDGIMQVVRHSVTSSTDDLFEKYSSGLTIVSSDPAYTGFDTNDMFDSGIFIYNDTIASTYTTTFEIDDYVELDIINLFGSTSRLTTSGPLVRAIGGIKLEANQNDTGTWVEILNETISGSYHYDDDGSISNFDIHESFPIATPHVAKEFRVTYSYLDSTTWAPRIDELDGFGIVMPAPSDGSTSDLCDLRANSGLTIVSSDPAYTGFDTNDMFDSGIFIYNDTIASTYTTTFEIDDYVDVNSIRLVSTASRLWSEGPLVRAVGGIKLEANFNDEGNWVEILNETISHNDYADDGTVGNFVLKRPFIIETLVAAKEFRVTYLYLDSTSWGPMIDELDLFGEVVAGPDNESVVDIFDLRNSSGLTIVSTDPVYTGSDPNNMFDSGIFIYDDTGAYSYTTTIEIDSVATVDSFRLLSTATRATAGNYLFRSIGRIMIEANTNTGTGNPNFVKILDEVISHDDYGDDGSVGNFALNKLFEVSNPVSSKEYKITYFVLDCTWLAPRIDALDAFDE